MFYVQSDDVVGTRIRLDFTVDPPPEIAVEVDLHHDSTSKLRNYCRAWRTSEVWRYDSIQMAMPHLDGETYVPVATSRALPMLTAARPTEYLTRKRDEG